jgi:hypothetical protein
MLLSALAALVACAGEVMNNHGVLLNALGADDSGSGYGVSRGAEAAAGTSRTPTATIVDMLAESLVAA